VMKTLKQKLSYLILGQKGGRKRMQIIDLLVERPYNLHQLSKVMDINYRTVRHHVDVLIRNEILSSSKTGTYGEVFFLTHDMESNMDIYHDVIKKFADITLTPYFFQTMLEKTHDSVIIMNSQGIVYFWNNSSEAIYGYTKEDINGKEIPIFINDDERLALIGEVSEGQTVHSRSITVRTRDGDHVQVLMTMDAIRDDNEKLVGYYMLSIPKGMESLN